MQKLLRVLKDEMTVLEMMTALKLGGRRNFLERYLIPAIDTGLVARQSALADTTLPFDVPGPKGEDWLRKLVTCQVTNL